MHVLSMYLRWHVLAIAALVVFSTRSSSAAERGRWTVERSDDADTCPDAKSLIEAVTARAGRNPLDATSEGKALDLHVAFTKQDGIHHAALRFGGARNGVRSLSAAGTTCAELTETVVVATTILVDDLRREPSPLTEPAVAAKPPPEAPTKTVDELGADLLLLVPIGAYRDYAGPSLGPTFRAGHPITPKVDLTVRTGFLLGLAAGSGHTQYHLETPVSIVPVWAGARYSFAGRQAGFYGACELGLNIILPHDQKNWWLSFRDPRLGFAANAGVGYVIGTKVDIRAQLHVLNLFEDIPRDEGASERTWLALGLSAGYTF